MTAPRPSRPPPSIHRLLEIGHSVSSTISTTPSLTARGRTAEQKKALYKAIADGLSASVGIRPDDVFIDLVEVKKENWSFGNGVAQPAT